VYIVSVQVRGFRDLPSASLTELDRQVRLVGPAPAVTALGDAIELGFAALSQARMHRLAVRWGLLADGLPPDAPEGALADEVLDCDPIAAAAILAPDARRALRVSLELHLDPPLFGQLRDHAAREPRVVTALAERPTIRLAVGALFTTSLDAMAVHIDEFSVGDVRFPVHGKDRPQWLGSFLRGLKDRFHRFDLGDDLPDELLDAATSRDRHEAYVGWQSALLPSGPRLRVARGTDDRPTLLGDDLPLRRFGQSGIDRAALAASVHLSGADIFWAESEDALLRAAVEESPSPLEQVFTVGPDGDVQVVADTLPEKTALQARRAWGRSRS